MASKNTKQAKRLAKVAALIHSSDLQATIATIGKVLAIDNRLRIPPVAHVKGNTGSVKTARATKPGAKKPFVVNK